MRDLINIDVETQTVSARELHKVIGSSERFSTWFERQLQFGFVEGEDYSNPLKVLRVQVEGNREVQREVEDYNLSVDMAKHICMVQRSEKAREVRQYLIDLEKVWNTPEQVMARALRLADETIEKLKNTNVSLLEDNQRMKPKAVFADAVSASQSSILVGDLAKLLKQNGVDIGQKRLFEWMRDNGYLIKQKGNS